nr:MAG TPA: hypothetical protein [Caudoviricetes sp.]
MTLGENIRNKRLEYDIEQQELAQRIGVNKATICGIETGVKIPSVAVLVRIADILHCSIDELLGRKVS